MCVWNWIRGSNCACQRLKEGLTAPQVLDGYASNGTVKAHQVIVQTNFSSLVDSELLENGRHQLTQLEESREGDSSGRATVVSPGVEQNTGLNVEQLSVTTADSYGHHNKAEPPGVLVKTANGVEQNGEVQADLQIGNVSSLHSAAAVNIHKSDKSMEVVKALGQDYGQADSAMLEGESGADDRLNNTLQQVDKSFEAESSSAAVAQRADLQQEILTNIAAD
ncbi:hypothetical protein LIER_12750 [Lithospermum erythrorhizon]|uniref:Uncharacterized protein n=1 Tax=Lithospermum erythrorhizon TaxID=34254 RepID=A0AAV3PV34_LITER